MPITLCLARPKVAPYDLPVELPVQLATGGLSQHVVDELQGPGCSNKNLARRPDAGRCSCGGEKDRPNGETGLIPNFVT